VPYDVSFELPLAADASRAARHAVDALPLHDHEHDEVVFNVRLLVADLVQNCLREAGRGSVDPITLGLRVGDGVLRVDVTDCSPYSGRPSVDRPARAAGRGLHLVDALADRWGTQPAPDKRGWLVWFEFDL
jgi:hypothetical protein